MKKSRLVLATTVALVTANVTLLGVAIGSPGSQTLPVHFCTLALLAWLWWIKRPINGGD
jgi:hypothetical protein